MTESYKKVLKSDIFMFPFTGIDLKKAAKLFANKFSCGSSVTGDDEIVIQGDFSYDVIELIQSNWPEVNYSTFYFVSMNYFVT